MRARHDDESTSTALGTFATWLIGFAMGMAALGALGLGDDERLPERPPRPTPPRPPGTPRRWRGPARGTRRSMGSPPT